MFYVLYDEWNRKNPRNINRPAKAAADKASLESPAESKRIQRTHSAAAAYLHRCDSPAAGAQFKQHDRL